MGESSPHAAGGADATITHSKWRRPPASAAERKRRKEFGFKYGGIMRDIKRERERGTE